MTPLPPDHSGVADYSEAWLHDLSRSAEIHVFTETAEPRASSAYASIETLDGFPYVSRKFDRVISVMGNSHFHLKIFNMLLRFGGACVAHDTRLINFYHTLLGLERARALAESELGRSVRGEDIERWVQFPQKIPTLFLSELCQSSAPLILHSPIARQMIANRFGQEPVSLPFAIYRPWSNEHLSPAARDLARRELGLPAGRALVVTFGQLGPDKAPEEVIWAAELLKSWGREVTLVFAGSGPEALCRNLQELVKILGLGDSVMVPTTSLSNDAYNRYLQAADAGIQLRTYRLGGLSGALLDCIAAALPSVATEHLAQATGAPRYIRTIPDTISPVLLAERVLEILESPDRFARPVHEKDEFQAEHSFPTYNRKLLEALELS